jgi:hypothetical protein
MDVVLDTREPGGAARAILPAVDESHREAF